MLTIKEFLKELRISRFFLYQHWRRGTGPERIKMGPRKILIPKEEIKNWPERLKEK